MMMIKNYNISESLLRKYAFHYLSQAIDFAVTMSYFEQHYVCVLDRFVGPFEHCFRYLNNPFNIRTNADFVGFLKSDNGFSTFQSLSYGVRAFVKLMQSYHVHYDLCTVSDIISRYAPRTENDTVNYVKLVSSQCESKDVFSNRTNFVKFAVAVLHMEQCIPNVPSVVVAFIIYYLLYYYDVFFKK